MQSYLELVARGDVRIAPLVDRTVAVDDAPAVYEALAKGEGRLPLGVVVEYPDVAEADEPMPSRMSLAGVRRTPSGRVNYALVGAGSFGTSMLVPQMRNARTCSPPHPCQPHRRAGGNSRGRTRWSASRKLTMPSCVTRPST
jgi:hypothetical protein